MKPGVLSSKVLQIRLILLHILKEYCLLIQLEEILMLWMKKKNRAKGPEDVIGVERQDADTFRFQYHPREFSRVCSQLLEQQDSH